MLSGTFAQQSINLFKEEVYPYLRLVNLCSAQQVYMTSGACIILLIIL